MLFPKKVFDYCICQNWYLSRGND